MKKVKIVATIITILLLMSLNTYAVETTEKDKEVELFYYTHVQDIGWEEKFCHKNGEIAGTTGRAKVIEAIVIKADNLPKGVTLKYQAHVRDIGWQSWKNNGEMAGTTGRAKSIEAIQIMLQNTEEYTIQYRVHVRDLGWQDWVNNGEQAGTTGIAKPIEAIQIKIIKRDGKILYKAHVSDIGWMNWMYDGEQAGTTGKAKPVEALYIKSAESEKFQIEYQAHVRDIGWMDWVENGEQAGTTGKAKPIEAIRIKFKEENSEYSIMYRAHVRDIGWMDWVYDGEQAGTTGRAKSVEAIQIKIVPKTEERVTIYETGTYGKSGLSYKGDSRGRNLEYYRFGNGPNVLFATFAVHGFEDKWNNDGGELVTIANNFYNQLKSGKYDDIAEKWTVYIFPEVNPDGRRYGYSHNGPGRTTLFSKAEGNKGIDINRCWEISGVPYQRFTESRNYNGTSGFQAYEAVALRDFLLANQSKTGQTILVDLHGWTNQLIGDEEICMNYYYPRFKNSDRSAVGRYGTGYLINWARSTLRSSAGNAKSVLIELPSNGVDSTQDVIKYNLSGRYIESTIEMLKNIYVPSNEIRVKAQSLVVEEQITEEAQFNTTLAGIIKENKPNDDEIEEIVAKENLKNGVWISERSRNEFLKLINSYTNQKYEIDDNGYLKIAKKSENKNDYDIALEKAMSSKKEYVIDIYGSYYSIDYVTKTIENNPFEKMDPYQICEYVEAENKKAIILTSNSQNKLDKKEIIDVLIEML